MNPEESKRAEAVACPALNSLMCWKTSAARSWSADSRTWRGRHRALPVTTTRARDAQDHDTSCSEPIRELSIEVDERRATGYAPPGRALAIFPFNTCEIPLVQAGET